MYIASYSHIGMSIVKHTHTHTYTSPQALCSTGPWGCTDMACVVPARTDGQINVFSQPRLCEGWVGGFEKIKR